MFLEIHTYIVDYKKRYLNLNELTKDDFNGWHHFGVWEDKGEFLICSGGWMSCFGKQFNKYFSELGLYHTSSSDHLGIIKKFNAPTQEEEDSTTTMTQILFLMMKEMKEKEKDREKI